MNTQVNTRRHNMYPTVTLENRCNNADRFFTPICLEMLEQLLLDGRKIFKRCCIIEGFAGDRIYFSHVDDSHDADNPPDLYWAPEHTMVKDLW